MQKINNKQFIDDLGLEYIKTRYEGRTNFQQYYYIKYNSNFEFYRISRLYNEELEICNIDTKMFFVEHNCPENEERYVKGIEGLLFHRGLDDLNVYILIEKLNNKLYYYESSTNLKEDLNIITEELKDLKICDRVYVIRKQVCMVKSARFGNIECYKNKC